jgi:phenylalanyl-tRNA synthetase beta chain
VVEELLDQFHLAGPVRFDSDGVPPYLDAFYSASIYHGGEVVGALGRLHPEVMGALDLKRPVYIFELHFDRLFELRQPQPPFQPLPKFPAVTRDMALIMDEELPVIRPLELIRGEKVTLLESMDVFDLYRGNQFGAGKKSVGYRLVYRAPDRSLTDEEVNEIHGRLVEKVLKVFNATLR